MFNLTKLQNKNLRKIRNFSNRITFFGVFALFVFSIAILGFTNQNTAFAAPGDISWQSANLNLIGETSITSITSSADGSKLAASVMNDYIYTSSDSGATWTKQTDSGSRFWTAIASSSDGTNLAAAANDGYIYTSSDSGATWVERDGTPDIGYWYTIASSSDGTKLVTGDSCGSIFTSTDSGATWDTRNGAGDDCWTAIASSANGAKLVAAGMSNVFTSTDSGATWEESNVLDNLSANWSGLASSSDGTKLAAAAYGDYLSTSTDSGATWTEQTAAGSRDWKSITSSSDGTKLAAAVEDGSIFTSTDSGATWTEQTAAGSRDWKSITSSADGLKLAAAVGDGNIYTGIIEGESTPDPTPPEDDPSPETPWQSNKSSLSTPASPIAQFSNKPVTITTPDGTTLSNSSTVKESDLTTQDDSNQYPLGLVNFSFTTSQTDNRVSLSIVTDLKPNQVQPKKYNPTTKTYANLPSSSNPVITETTVNGKHVLVLTYTITDNGELDLNPANGQITDPVGLAVTNEVYNQLAVTGVNNLVLAKIASSILLLSVSGLVMVFIRSKNRRNFKVV